MYAFGSVAYGGAVDSNQQYTITLDMDYAVRISGLIQLDTAYAVDYPSRPAKFSPRGDSYSISRWGSKKLMM